MAIDPGAQGRMGTLSSIIEEGGVAEIHQLKIDAEKSELDILRGILDRDWPKK